MKKVDWTPAVKLRDGTEARYLGACSITGKHRVMRSNAGRPLKNWMDNESATVWLLNDFGSACDGLRPSEKDYAAAA